MLSTTAGAQPVPDVEPTASEHPARVPALDGLRGVAVAGVVLYHAGHLKGGFLGVDLFFVLSGYLITTLLLRSVVATGTIRLGHFWSRRARRLLPAIGLLLVVVVPVYAIWFASKTDLAPVRDDGLASLFYVTNWSQIWRGQSYFAATLAASPLRHLWSLAVEEQFYLFWPPIVLVVARRWGVRGVFRVALTCAVASGLLMIVLGVTEAVSFNALYLGTHTRAAAVLAGSALAGWFALHGPPRSAGMQRVLRQGAVEASLVLGALWVVLAVDEPALYAGGFAVSALAGTVLVAAAATSTSGIFVRVLTLAPLRYLGTISYGVYLWSWPITVMLSGRHTELEGLPLLLVQVILTLSVASLSYQFVEKPILDGALRRPWSGIVLGVGAIGAAAAVLIATAGAIAVPSTAVSTAGYAISAKPGAPRLMVVGDSVPSRIAQEGIIPLKDELGVSTVDRTVPGCILLRSVGEVKGVEGDIRHDVRPCNNDWDGLVDRFRPDVVLMQYGEFPNDQVRIDGAFNLPCTADYQREQRRVLTEGLDDLTSQGARVVIATAPGSSVDWVLEGFPAGMNDRVACMNALYKQIAAARDDVDVVDFASYVCPRGRCVDTLDGINLREDTLHFRGASAELVSRWLVPRVLGQKSGSGTPKRAAWCRELTGFASFVDQLLELPEQGTTEADRKAALEEARDSVGPAFASTAPEVMRGDAARVAAGWDGLLDRWAALPPDATPLQLAGAARGLAAPVAHIRDWHTVNCA